MKVDYETMKEFSPRDPNSPFYVEPSKIEFLEENNPILSPEYLGSINKKYKYFKRLSDNGPGKLIYIYPKTWENVLKIRETQEGQKAIILLSGLPAIGKNTILNSLTGKYPDDIITPSTITTREPRKDESRDDYWFTTEKDYLKRENNLVGKVNQYGAKYGLPEVVLDAFLNQNWFPPRFVLTLLELSGHQDLREYIEENYSKDPPLIESIFVLPQIPYKEYIGRLRLAKREYHQERVNHAQWEISEAPSQTGIFLINPLEDQPGKSATEALAMLLFGNNNEVSVDFGSPVATRSGF